MGRSPLSRAVVAIKEDRLVLQIVPWLAARVVQCLFRCLRVVHVDRAHAEGCWARGERIIVAFWHGRLLMMPFAYPGQPGAILISQHRDGEYISRIAAHFGFEVIRGSATRGGMRAAKQMVRTIRNGLNLVITPDGPRGPHAQVKSGIIEMARLTGAPIVPVSFSASRRRILGSWDRFLVPIPFSHAVYIWGQPMYVPRTATKSEVTKHREALEERLNLLTLRADTYFGAGR